MTLILVLNTEVSSIQRSFNTLKYYTGTQNGVLIIEVSTFQRFVIERFHCIFVNLGPCKGLGATNFPKPWATLTPVDKAENY